MELVYPRLIAATMNGLFSLALGLFALAHNPKARSNRYFASFQISFAFLSMSGYALFVSDTTVGVLLYRALYGFSLWVVFFLNAFLQDLTGVYDRPLSRRVRRAMLLIALVGYPLTLTPAVIRNFSYTPGVPVLFNDTAGPLYEVFFLLFGVSLVGFLVFVGLQLRRMTGVRRNQLKYVMLGLSLGVVVSLSRALLVADRMIWVYAALQALLSFCLAYAIFQFHLFDFGVWMRRAAIFSGLYIALIGIPFLFHSFPGLAVNSGSWPVAVVAYGLLFSLAPVIANFVQQRTESRRWTYLRHQLETVRATAEGLSAENSPSRESLCGRVTDLLRDAYWNRIETPLRFIRVIARKSDGFAISNYPSLPMDGGPLLKFMNELDHALNSRLSQPFDPVGWRTLMALDHASADPVGRFLEDNGVELCCPALQEGRLVGLVLLGSKSVGIFQPEEVATLHLVTSHFATALRKCELLEKNKELVTLDSLKADLISNITHEFKAPLNVVDAAVNVLMSDVSRDRLSKERLGDYLIMIRNNTTRLSQFIQNLLEVARIEQSRIDLLLEKAEVDRMMSDAVEVLRPLASRKKIALDLALSSGVRLDLDVDKISQVFCNLVSNAIKFTDTGFVRVESERRDGWVRLVVRDTGRGIEPAYLSNVFEKFFQVPEKSNVSEGGTGLGLAIAKGWVDAHGGRIWVESEGKGAGAAFYVELPIDRNEEAA